MGSRFPGPAFYHCYPGHSKERFLKSKVNPTKNNEENENLITDESDLSTFTKYLVDVIVNEKISWSSI